MVEQPPTENENPPADADEVQATERFERLGRLRQWAAEHRAAAVLATGGALVGVSAIALLACWLVLRGPKEEVTLEEALAKLDAGLFEEAHEMGKMLANADSLPADSFGGPAFVMGAALAYEADQAFVKEKKPYYLLSSRYLQQAHELGFPPDRRGEGLFLLARALMLSEQIPASRPILREALKVAPNHRSEILWLLTEACLDDSSPRYEEALEANEKYLSDRVMTPADRRRGLLQRARILLGLKRKAECLEVLAEIPEGAKDQAEALVIRAGILISEADELTAGFREDSVDDAETAVRQAANAKYDEAIEILRVAQQRDTLSVKASGKAMYLTGICLLKKREFPRALEQFSLTSRSFPGTLEALAADFQMAELLRTMNRHDDALEAYLRALDAVDDPRNYGSPWIPLRELQSRTINALEDYLQREDFSRAKLLAENLHPLLPKPRVTELIATVHAGWGRYLLAGAQSQEAQDVRQQEATGREHLRRAGVGFAALAKMRIVTDHYPEDLWQSAQCYMEGHDFRHAADILQEYLKNGTRKHRPRALVDLGAAHLNLGRMDASLAAFEECIEFHPRDASAYRARLIASEAHAEKGEMEQAQSLLETNLNGHLAPESIEWRDSLFSLGRLLYRQKRYQEAAERLEEAVRRYPNDSGALESRYLLAECCRAGAQSLMEQREKELVESVRNASARKAHEYLVAAVEHYAHVQQALNEKQEHRQLTEVERKTLRNCYFAIGAVWFDLGDYGAAIRAYTAASTRYQNEPEALEAYVQIARAQRRSGEHREAQATIRRGKEVLKLLKQRSGFLATTNLEAAQWEDMLAWMESL